MGHALTQQDVDFFMVYGDGKSSPQFKHRTFAEAEREARRLAACYPDVAFYVMMPIGYARRRPDIEFVEINGGGVELEQYEFSPWR